MWTFQRGTGLFVLIIALIMVVMVPASLSQAEPEVTEVPAAAEFTPTTAVRSDGSPTSVPTDTEPPDEVTPTAEQGHGEPATEVTPEVVATEAPPATVPGEPVAEPVAEVTPEPSSTSDPDASADEDQDLGIMPLAMQTSCQLAIDDAGDDDPFTYNFTGIGSADISAYSFDPGDGSVSIPASLPSPTTVSHAYSATGAFPVSLTCDPATGDDLVVTGSVTINTIPVPDFDVIPTDNFIGFTPYSFTTLNRSTGGQLTYAWEITSPGGAVVFTSTDENIAYTATEYGTYLIKLTVTDRASQVASTSGRTVAVYPSQPTASIAINRIAGDTPLIVTVSGQDLGGGPIESWSWDFGDGSTATGIGPHTVTYNNTGTYRITMRATGPSPDGNEGPFFEQYLDVTAYPDTEPVVAGFDYRVVSIDASGVNVCFTDTSTGPVTEWAWDFNSDSTLDATDINPCFTFPNEGSFPVRLVVSNADLSSVSTKSFVITAFLSPTASFTITPPGGFFWMDTIHLDSTASVGTITEWLWEIDRGSGFTTFSTSQNPDLQLLNLGSNTIRLTVSGPGGSSFVESIIFVSRIGIVCDFSGPQLVSPGDALQGYTSIVTSTLNPDPRTITYEWFVDGTSVSADANPTIDWGGFGAGQYSLTMRASTDDGAACERTRTVTVAYPPLVCDTLISPALPAVVFPAGDAYAFEADVSGLDGRTIATLDWTLTVTGSSSASGNTASVTFDAEPPGGVDEIQTIRYVVTASDGSTCFDEVTTTLRPFTPVTCGIASDPALPASILPDGTSYEFSVVDVNGLNGRTITGYAWTLDNNSAGAGSTFTHSWVDNPAAPYTSAVGYSIKLSDGSTCSAQIETAVSPLGLPNCQIAVSPALPNPMYADGVDYTFTAVLPGQPGYAFDLSTMKWVNSPTDDGSPTSVRRWDTEPATTQGYVVSYSADVIDTATGALVSTCNPDTSISIQPWPALSCSISGELNPLPALPDNTSRNYTYNLSVSGLAGRTFSTSWTVDPATLVTSGNTSATLRWPASESSVAPGTLQPIAAEVNVSRPDGTDTINCNTSVRVQVPKMACEPIVGDIAPVFGETEIYSASQTNLFGRPVALNWTMEQNISGVWTIVDTQTGPTFTFEYTVASAQYRLSYAASVSDPADACGSAYLPIQVTGTDQRMTCDAFPAAGNTFIIPNASGSSAYTVDIDNGNGLSLDLSYVLVGPGAAERVLASFTSSADGLITGPAIPWADFGPIGNYNLRVDVTPPDGSRPCALTQPVAVGALTIRLTETTGATPSAVAVGQQLCLLNDSDTTHLPGDITQLDYAWQITGAPTDNSLGATSATSEQLNCFHFTQPGAYTVTLTGENRHNGDNNFRMTGQQSLTFNVYGLQRILIDHTPPRFAPAIMNFQAFGTNITGGYNWTFTDSGGNVIATRTGAIPTPVTFTQPGAYTALVTGTGPLGTTSAETSFTLISGTALQASFVPDIYATLAPARICFTDTSVGNPTSWVWDFGNGQTLSYDQFTIPAEICTTYTTPDRSFPITLTITVGVQTNFALNTIQTLSQSAGQSTFRIQPGPGGLFCFEPIVPPGVALVGWDFGDGNATGADDPACHGYQSSGNFIVTMIVTTGRVIRPVTVVPNPAVPVLSITATCTANGLATFTITNTGDDMQTQDQAIFRDFRGNVIAIRQVLLNNGESMVVSLPNQVGTVTGSLTDANTSANADCPMTPNVNISASCSSENAPVFLIRNDGDPMFEAQPFTVWGPNGESLVTDSFDLGRGESVEVFVPTGSYYGGAVVLRSSGIAGDFEVNGWCYPDGDFTPTPEPSVTPGSPGTGGGIPPRVPEGLSTDLLNVNPADLRRGCGDGCPVFRLYHSDQTGAWNIWRVDGNDGNYTHTNLTFGPEGSTDYAPSISPNNDWIVFSSNRDGNWELYLASTTGSEASVRRMTYNSVAIDTDPVWGPNNFVLYETTENSNWDLYIVNMDNGERFRVTDNTFDDINGRWSDDGTRIVYQGSDMYGRWQIFEVDLATMTRRQVTDDSDYNVEPDYLPDGRILYRSYVEEGSDSIFKAITAGGIITRLTPVGENATNGSVSPSGRYLAYQAATSDGNYDIYVYEFATRERRQVTDSSTMEVAPTWLCEDERIVFMSTASGNPDIYEADALPISAPPVDMGDDVDQLTDTLANDIYPLSSPAEENASREGQTVLGVFCTDLGFLNPDANRTVIDVSIIWNQSTWPTDDLSCRP